MVLSPELIHAKPQFPLYITPNLTILTNMKRTSFYLQLFSAVAVALLMTACSSTHEAADIQPTRSAGPVTLGAGDVLEIRFFNTPELNQTQTVRPDGKIALPLIHEVNVEGRTVPELRSHLENMYTPHLKYPDVTVVVRSLHSNKIYVGGEVNSPGTIELTGRLTALEAVMQAGGFNETTARKQSVVLVRHTKTERYGYKLNLRAAMKGSAREEIMLEPYDIIYVPRKNIVHVNTWIDQYIDDLIPQPVLSTIPFVVYQEMFRE